MLSVLQWSHISYEHVIHYVWTATEVVIYDQWMPIHVFGKDLSAVWHSVFELGYAVLCYTCTVNTILLQPLPKYCKYTVTAYVDCTVYVDWHISPHINLLFQILICWWLKTSSQTNPWPVANSWCPLFLCCRLVQGGSGTDGGCGGEQPPGIADWSVLFVLLLQVLQPPPGSWSLHQSYLWVVTLDHPSQFLLLVGRLANLGTSFFFSPSVWQNTTVFLSWSVHINKNKGCLLCSTILHATPTWCIKKTIYHLWHEIKKKANTKLE